MHDKDPAGHGHGLHLVVGDVDDGRPQATVELADLGPHGNPQLGVQVGERLVEQKHLGLADDRPSDRDALPLPARELLGFAVQQFMDAEDVGGLLHPLVDFRFGKLAHFQSEAQVVPDVHVRVEGIILKDHGDVAVFGLHVVDLPVADENLAGCHRLEAGDHAQRRGLAAAGRPHQHGELPVVDLDAQAVDRGHGLEFFDHIFKDDVRHRACLSAE